MAWPIIGGLLGLAGIGASMWGASEDRELSQKQFEQQMNWQTAQNQLQRNENRNYFKQGIELQHKAWERDDNAFQRKVQQYEAAGLNPILAAGGSIMQSQANVSGSAPSVGSAPSRPQMPQHPAHKLAMLAPLVNQLQQSRYTAAQTDMLNERKNNEQLRGFLMNEDLVLKKFHNQKKMQDYQMKMLSAKIGNIHAQTESIKQAIKHNKITRQQGWAKISLLRKQYVDHKKRMDHILKEKAQMRSVTKQMMKLRMKYIPKMYKLNVLKGFFGSSGGLQFPRK